MFIKIMRKGHRRTQSSYINATYHQQQQTKTQPPKHQEPTHQILNLLRASDDKVSTKIINFQKLQFDKEHQPSSSQNSTCSSQQIRNVKKYATQRKEYTFHQLSPGIQLGFHKFDKISPKSNQLKVDLEKKFKKKEQRNIYFFKNSKIQQENQAEQEKRKLRKSKKRIWH